MPRHPKETKAEWLKRLASIVFMTEAERSDPYFNGPFAITTSVQTVGRKTYPMQVYLRIKLGDPRTALELEPHWSEIERLHADLGRILDERKALKKKLEPYRDGRVGK